MQPEMRPVLRQRRAQADGALAIGISREEAQGAADFGDVDAVDEADGTEMMAMQAFGEPPQQRLIGIGRIAFDDQLTPGDAKGDERAIDQQPRGAPGH